MPNDPFHSPQRYRFAEFEFREQTGELWRGGKGLPLPDQAGRVLLALLRAPGEMVTREALQKALWPDKVCGDFEGGLHAAVRKLRRALDDDGSEPRLIGTLPRRGYRLLVPVTAAEERPGHPGSPDFSAPLVGPLREDRTAPLRRTGKRHLFVLLGLFFALLSAGAFFWKPWWPWPQSIRTLALPGGVKLDLVYLPAGDFAMGFDTGYKATEPVHRVTLTHGFWIGKTEVTQAQWRAVMGNNPAYFQGDDKPVEQVSWDDCQTFLKRLNQLGQSFVYRLPTEAEWEYAARAARLTSTYAPGEAFAWDASNSQGQTHPVGQKQPNPWGLLDMLGNVWEWCSDGFGPYLPYPQQDPQSPTAELRTVRGGSWLNPRGTKGVGKISNRITLRYGYAQDFAASDLGFRVVAVQRTP